MLHVRGVDLIAMPGPDGLVLPERITEWQAAVAQVNLLIGAHFPRILAVIAHQRCAGHPVTDATHDVDVLATAKSLKDETAFKGPVRAIVAVYRTDTAWDLKQTGEF